MESGWDFKGALTCTCKCGEGLANKATHVVNTFLLFSAAAWALQLLSFKGCM